MLGREGFQFLVEQVAQVFFLADEGAVQSFVGRVLAVQKMDLDETRPVKFRFGECFHFRKMNCLPALVDCEVLDSVGVDFDYRSFCHG